MTTAVADYVMRSLKLTVQPTRTRLPLTKGNCELLIDKKANYGVQAPITRRKLRIANCSEL
ncbi:hypothetical protein FACHB389_01610 [Nostoc calcicola FACHB-389]|nr:hypothetical protein [Nostoc calcicola FACHB-3891]OKH42377.1 hypothetical protein FACHB389_01610 [Nostoc calcicola FACHB-389]